MRILALVPLLTLGCGAFGGRQEVAPAPTRAQAELRDPGGQSVGQVTLEQTAHGVLIAGTLTGMPAGSHAIHVHETGSCTPTFEAAGGHFNPFGREHGIRNAAGKHAGDLPNIHVSPDGTARFELVDRDLAIARGKGNVLDGDGSSVVIHAVADDYQTNPSGNSGARIACGVIRR